MQRKLLTLAEARARKQPLRLGAGIDIPKPEFLGTRAFPDVPLADLVPFIDWGPFFNAWELFGAFPKILEDEKVGVEAKKLYADAQALLARIIKEKRFRANAVIGFWPCNAVGDDVELYTDEARSKVLGRLPHAAPADGEAARASSTSPWPTSWRPKESGRLDYCGGFAVTAGLGVEEFAESFRKQHDDYSAIMVQALGDRLAEAFAEYMHKQARELCGFGKSEDLSNEQLIREQYRGIRPAPGYPACPEHTEKGTLFQLLDAHEGRRASRSPRASR